MLDSKSKSDSPSSEFVKPAKLTEISERDRQWQFRVHVTQPLTSFEAVAVTGDCAALGNWLPQHGVFLQRDCKY